MQDILDNKDLTTELTLFEALLEEQNLPGGQQGLPIKAIGKVRDYVKSSEAILILLDHENAGWANRKLLGSDQTWIAETAFLLKDSILCSFTAEYITSITYASTSDPRFDSVVFAEVTTPIRNIIMAPLISNEAITGMTPQEQKGLKAPTIVARMMALNGLAANARLMCFEAPDICTATARGIVTNR